MTLTAGGSNNLDIDLGIYDSSTLGLSKVNFDAVSIYPNPVYFLTINTQLTDYEYTIYSVQGQLITSKASNNQMQRIGFNNFTTGVYVLIINTNEKSYSYKVITLACRIITTSQWCHDLAS